MRKIISLVVVACMLLSLAIYNISADTPAQVELTEEYIARADIRKTYEKDEESPYYLEKYIQKHLSTYEELYWLLKLTNASGRVVVKFDLKDSAKSFMPYLWVAGDKCAKIKIEASKTGSNWLEIVSPVAVEYNNYYGDTPTLGPATAWPEGVNQENINKVLEDNPTKEVYLSFKYAGSAPDSELQLQGFGITAKYDATPTDIEITKIPKVHYTSAEARDVRDNKEELDVSNGMIKITYSDGTVRYHKMNEHKVSLSVDRSKIATEGEHEVTVMADGLKASYKIKTLRGVVKGIEMVSPPKNVFEVGDALDVTGGEIKVLFNGSKIEPITIPISEEMIDGFNTGNIVEGLAVNVIFGEKTTQYTIDVLEKSEAKEESVRIDVQPYTSGEEELVVEDLDVQQAIWEERFGPEKNPGRTDKNLNDFIKDSSYSMSYLKGSEIWLDVFAGGHLTLEIDLPDRAISFNLTRGWGVYANCKVLASKDDGKTWYIVGRVLNEVSAMGTVFYSEQLSEEQIAKTYEWMLIGNPEKKFLLKFVPDLTDELEGKIGVCNFGYTYEYNKGMGNLDKDLPTTVPEGYEIPKEYDENDYPTVVQKFDAFDDFEDFEGNPFDDNYYDKEDTTEKPPVKEETKPEVEEPIEEETTEEDVFIPSEEVVTEEDTEIIETVTNTPNKKVTKVEYRVKVVREKDDSLAPWIVISIVAVSGVLAGALVILSVFGVKIYIKKRKNLERKI